MIRTFTLPSAPFPLYDPSTEEPVKDAKGEAVTLTHREVFRTIILDPRLRSDLDTFELYDLPNGRPELLQAAEADKTTDGLRAVEGVKPCPYVVGLHEDQEATASHLLPIAVVTAPA